MKVLYIHVMRIMRSTWGLSGAMDSSANRDSRNEIVEGIGTIGIRVRKQVMHKLHFGPYYGGSHQARHLEVAAAYNSPQCLLEEVCSMTD